MDNDKYFGGAFFIARKMFQSEIWLYKPSSWKIIWIYILGKVNHKENKQFKRGEGYFNFTNERKNIGNDITLDVIKKFLSFARRSSMISTTRSTRGMNIKIINYNTYQTLDSYTSTTPSTREAPEKHQRSTPINKNDKKEKNDNKEGSEQSSQEVNSLIKAFSVINPACSKMYGNTTQRQACVDLIENYGFDRVLTVVEKTLLKTNGLQYFPTIISPVQLKDKWVSLESAIRKHQSEKLSTNNKYPKI